MEAAGSFMKTMGKLVRNFTSTDFLIGLKSSGRDSLIGMKRLLITTKVHN